MTTPGSENEPEIANESNEASGRVDWRRELAKARAEPEQVALVAHRNEWDDDDRLGLDFDAAMLPFFKATSSPRRIRILARHPVPPDAKIPAIWRLEIEDENRSRYLLDVTSKRLASQISALARRRDWFEIARHGKGTSTIYEVHQEARSP